MSYKLRKIIKSGTVFGNWVIIKEAKPRKHTRYFLCTCTCSAGTTTEVQMTQLTRGTSTGCVVCGHIRAGVSNRHGKGLLKDDPIYIAYLSMKSRCAGTLGRQYKQKEIKVSQEWSSFLTFKAWCLANGYVKGLVLHRLDDDGPYSPDNCVFLTRSEHTLLHHDLGSYPQTAYTAKAYV